MASDADDHATISRSTLGDHVTVNNNTKRDTAHFLNKLNNIGQLPNGVLLVTLDVTSLYTNIPHKDGIQASSDFLERRTNPTIKTTRLCDLIELILTNNTFTFNGQHCRQMNGTAMGTKIAPSGLTPIFLWVSLNKKPWQLFHTLPDLVAFIH